MYTVVELEERLQLMKLLEPRLELMALLELARLLALLELVLMSPAQAVSGWERLGPVKLNVVLQGRLELA